MIAAFDKIAELINRLIYHLITLQGHSSFTPCVSGDDGVVAVVCLAVHDELRDRIHIITSQCHITKLQVYFTMKLSFDCQCIRR